MCRLCAQKHRCMLCGGNTHRSTTAMTSCWWTQQQSECHGQTSSLLSRPLLPHRTALLLLTLGESSVSKCLLICLSACLSVCCLCVCLACPCLAMCLSLCLSLWFSCLSVQPCVCLHLLLVCLTICLSVCLSVCLSCLSVWPHVCLSDLHSFHILRMGCVHHLSVCQATCDLVHCFRSVFCCHCHHICLCQTSCLTPVCLLPCVTQ